MNNNLQRIPFQGKLFDVKDILNNGTIRYRCSGCACSAEIYLNSSNLIKKKGSHKKNCQQSLKPPTQIKCVTSSTKRYKEISVTFQMKLRTTTTKKIYIKGPFEVFSYTCYEKNIRLQCTELTTHLTKCNGKHQQYSFQCKYCKKMSLDNHTKHFDHCEHFAPIHDLCGKCFKKCLPTIEFENVKTNTTEVYHEHKCKEIKLIKRKFILPSSKMRRVRRFFGEKKRLKEGDNRLARIIDDPSNERLLKKFLNQRRDQTTKIVDELKKGYPLEYVLACNNPYELSRGFKIIFGLFLKRKFCKGYLKDPVENIREAIWERAKSKYKKEIEILENKENTKKKAELIEQGIKNAETFLKENPLQDVINPNYFPDPIVTFCDAMRRRAIMDGNLSYFKFCLPDKMRIYLEDKTKDSISTNESTISYSSQIIQKIQKTKKIKFLMKKRRREVKYKEKIKKKEEERYAQLMKITFEENTYSIDETETYFE
jgi:hypothetical protein